MPNLTARRVGSLESVAEQPKSRDDWPATLRVDYRLYVSPLHASGFRYLQ